MVLAVNKLRICWAAVWEVGVGWVGLVCLTSFPVFHCCIRTYHKLGDVKQHPVVSSQFYMLKFKFGVAGFSAQDLTRIKSRH